MRKAIISLILLSTPLWALAQAVDKAKAQDKPRPQARAQASAQPVLRDDAPDRYIVVQGDTLWSISGRFLQNPWQWPEIWKMNQDQIKNPHRIYPGDVIVLDRLGGEARLRLVQLETERRQPQIRVEALPPKPVPTIPPAVIEPFLAKPLLVGQTELDRAPRISATQENRVAVGAGAVVYVSGLSQDRGPNWQIFRRGDPLVDPDTKELLGYEAVYLGEARVLKFAEESTVEVTRSVQEVYVGDRLIAAEKEVPNFGYVPRAPGTAVRGRIVSGYGGLGEAGPLSIVTLSKGSKDGLEVGHVLAIYRSQSSARYEMRTSPLYGRQGVSGSDRPRTYHAEQLIPRDGPLYRTTEPVTDEQIAKLPDERYGLVMVFRTFDRAAFGVIMQASRPVALNDLVTNP
jgi:LysM domain-containing protein